MAELFFDTYHDLNLKEQKLISHDEKVTAIPAGMYAARWKEWETWKSFYVLDDQSRLWDKPNVINEVFEMLSNKSVTNALDLQDCTETQIVKTLSGEEYDYDLGEIKVECLVRFHDSDTYYSFLGTEHKRNSVGYIVGLRILNYEELLPKYQYRQTRNVEDWELF